MQLLHLLPGSQLLQINPLGLGSQPEAEGVNTLLHDLEHGREASEERDEAALPREAEVSAEAAELFEAHDAVRLVHEDVADLEHQLQLLLALDHVVERCLLPPLYGGGDGEGTPAR